MHVSPTKWDLFAVGTRRQIDPYRWVLPVVADERFSNERLFHDDFATLGEWLRRWAGLYRRNSPQHCPRLPIPPVRSGLPSSPETGAKLRIEPFSEARNGHAQRIEDRCPHGRRR
jgi:hypothetical protein